MFILGLSSYLIYLIDKKGKVVAINLRGKDLENLLVKIYQNYWTTLKRYCLLIAITLCKMMNAIEEGKYAFFLSTYPDSPVSILFLSSLLVLKQNRIMGVEVNLIALADLLSEGLKHSDKGKVLMDKIRIFK